MVTASDALEVIAPTGFRLLVRLLEAPAKTRGGIDIPESRRIAEQLASCKAEVIALGGAAYKDPDKFPDGPWCQVGDTILMRSYSGTNFKVDGEDFRLINDDTVEGVIFRPERVTREL